ncbi:MAG TPA: HD domain-containing phosphohydrolase [Acidobacteriota bacterium]|jgi:putative two-component system response regulator
MGKTDTKILVLDADLLNRSLLSHWLTAEGYDCSTATSAEEAWSLLEGGNFCLVIWDLVMPGQSGMELLAVTVGRFPDVAVVTAAQIDDRRSAVRALQIGAYGYLVKPFELNEVVISVSNALERRRLLLARRHYQEKLEEEVQKRTEEVRRRELEIAMRLVTATGYRDGETGAHVRRIGLYSEVLAKALGWSGHLIDEIKVAAPMHDIGKIAVPDSILLKPDALSSEEFEILKKHTETGARILGGSDIPLLAMAGEIALCHHERWDGGGYPRGLSGEAIPESARIVAIADVYDALLHKRIYKPAFSEDDALEVMREESGRQFDPLIFDHFLRVVPQFQRIRIQWSDALYPSLVNPSN